MATVDLSFAFELAHGYKSTAFDPKFSTVKGDRYPNRKEFADLGSEYYAIGPNGREYYMPVNLQYPDATGALQSYYLPYPVIGIRGDEHFVDTPMTDRRGSVSEYINMNNYEISIKGVMVASGNEFPEDLMKEFQAVIAAIRDAGGAQLFCAATDMWLQPIGSMVTVRSFDTPPIPGVKHVRGYTLLLKSDSIFELTDIS